MKVCYVDANILVTFKNKLSPNHKNAVELLNALVRENYSLLISPLIIDEFLHPMKYILRIHKQIYIALHEVLTDIFRLPGLTLVNAPVDKNAQFKVIQLMEKFHLRPRDAYHLLIMQVNQIDTVATFDSDFDQVFQEGIIRHYKVAATS